jgi:c-di-GMP-binding flagellar brake protein YcgR
VDSATRKFKRIKVDIRVRLRRWDQPEAESFVVRTYELSIGGMSVYGTETQPVGTMMRVELSLPGLPEKFDITAVIRNQRGFRLGMEFLDISNNVKSEIERYLAAEEGVVEI